MAEPLSLKDFARQLLLQAFAWYRKLRESRGNQREKYGVMREHVRPEGSQNVA